jgi:Flp pilus assembly protein TadG
MLIRDAGRPPGGESGANPKVSDLPFTSSGKVESTRLKGEWTENGFPVKRMNAAGRLHMRLFRDEQGQTLVFTAFLGCCLLGFMALAIDVGVLFRAQRRVQTAADAGAVAAGLASDYGMTVTGCGTGVTSVTCAVYKAAAQNGVTDTTQITVNNPPVNGSHVGAEYYEVIIRQPNPTLFMSAFNALTPGGSANSNSMTVAARAVSGIVPGADCAFALDKHADDAFDVQGAAVITTPNCSIQINSDSQQALCTTGGKATINSIAINIVGAQNPKGKCNNSQSNAYTGVDYVPDPLGGLTYPTCDGTNTFAGTNITSSSVISGTTFTSETETVGTGPTATTASVVCFSGKDVTIADGVTLGTTGGKNVFVFNNGVKIGGTVTINGTLVNAGGSLNQSNFALTINAPADTTATYNGLAIIVPPTNTSNTCGGSYSSFKGTPAPGGCLQIQFGSSYGNLDGMIYAPAAAVYMQDNGGGTVVTAIIADEIYDKSSNLIMTNNYNYVHSTSPLNHVALVE